MNLKFKCLPTGALPYTDIKAATRMIMRLFEKVPYLPFFPILSAEETILNRTLGNIPAVYIKDGKVCIDIFSDEFLSTLNNIKKVYNTPNEENLEEFKFESLYTEKYFQIIERVKPDETVINLLGPFSIAQITNTSDVSNPFSDKTFRKFIVQLLTIRSLWIINKIKKISPKTTPIIMFEEPKLNEFGVVKKENEAITKELLINVYIKIFQSLHLAGAAVGIQCYKKCDWQIPIDSGVDIISFDAYNNSGNLAIISDKIEAFLKKGGYINWAIVPVNSEKKVKTLTIDHLYEKFLKSTGELGAAKVNFNLLYSRAKVSVQDDVSELPLIFAEKALILANQLGNRIPNKKKAPTPQ